MPTSDLSSPRLYAIADLHLSYPLNTAELEKIAPHPHDSLILAGDIGEKPEQLHLALRVCTERFKNVYWVPGNHDLYSIPSNADTPEAQPKRGVAKYEQGCEIARQWGVATPEDEWPLWSPGEGKKPVLLALMFTLYDYTFAPDGHDTPEKALAWAREVGTEATDELLLHPEPYPTRAAWGKARLAYTKDRLRKAREQHPDVDLVMVNHWPLRRDVIYIPLAPRFEIWCGSRETEGWPEEFGAKVVVTGHLHVRRTDWIGDVRYEECSLGYPRQWEDARGAGKGVGELMREIWPGDESWKGKGTKWRRYG